MNNTRQYLKFKINCSTEELNIILNSYLIYERYIQTYYNDEKVLKLNSFFAMQSFYDTYLKIYLTNSELTVIGWITYKGIEYGFDDKLNLEDFAFRGNWIPIQQLYVLFRDIVSRFKFDDQNEFICEKRKLEDIIEPQEENLFVPNLKFCKNKSYAKIIAIIVLFIFFGIPILMVLFFQ